MNIYERFSHINNNYERTMIKKTPMEKNGHKFNFD